MRYFVRKRFVAVTTAVAAVATFLVAVLLSPSGAQAACTQDQYTVGGVFDLQGYLACLAAESGGTIPGTGSNTMQIIGVALAFLVIGAAATFAPRRTRTPAR